MTSVVKALVAVYFLVMTVVTSVLTCLESVLRMSIQGIVKSVVMRL